MKNIFDVTTTMSSFLPKQDMGGMSKISLSDIGYQTREIQDGCRDIHLDNLMSLDFVALPHLLLKNIGKTLFDEGEDAALTRWSASQLWNRYGIPVLYALKCLNKNHAELLETNVSTWMLEDNIPAMFRLYDDLDGNTSVRGIVSEHYAKFDAPDIVKCLAKNEKLAKNFSPRSYYLDPERMHIRFVANQMMDVKGEDLYVGIMSDSSDVGKMAVNLRLFVLNMSSKNAIILPTGGMTYRQVHRGKSEDGFADDISGVINAIPTMEESVKIVIKACKDKALKAIIDIEKDKDAALNFSKKYGFDQKTVQKAIDILSTGKYGSTVWGFVNALTEAAETLELERRIAAEKAAGSLLFMSTQNSN